MAEHKDLPDSQLHESKGVSTASVNTVYVADGSGSGSWKKLDLVSLNTSSSLYNLNKDILQATLPDVSEPNTIVLPVVSPRTLTKVTAVLTNAITVANSILSFYNNTTLIGTLTIAYSGSAEGTTFTYTPISNNTFTTGSRIKIVNDGGSTTASHLELVLEFTITG